MDLEKLREHARNIRMNIIREVSNAQSGHPGGSLSLADILTVLYFEVMDINKDNAGSLERDRFVLSKGHASPALYAVFAEKGSRLVIDNRTACRDAFVNFVYYDR